MGPILIGAGVPDVHHFVATMAEKGVTVIVIDSNTVSVQAAEPTPYRPYEIVLQPCDLEIVYETELFGTIIHDYPKSEKQIQKKYHRAIPKEARPSIWIRAPG